LLKDLTASKGVNISIFTDPGLVNEAKDVELQFYVMLKNLESKFIELIFYFGFQTHQEKDFQLNTH
jgi:hypothetical protein